jgi:hypothetical protein
MNKRSIMTLGLGSLILCSCTVQGPSAAEIANQVESDLRTQNYAAQQLTNAPAPAPTPEPQAEASSTSGDVVSVSDAARTQAANTITNMSFDDRLDLIARTLDTDQRTLNKNGYSDEANEVGMLAAWARGLKHGGANMIVFTCTQDNIDWFHTIANRLLNIASQPWTAETAANSDDQERADTDEHFVLASAFVEKAAKLCRDKNAHMAAAGRPPRHKHHHRVAPSLPKGMQNL